MRFERAIDSIGHRAHLVPEFELRDVATPRENLLGKEGEGLALAMGAFTGTAALVGIFGVALMRSAFDFALKFAKTEKRGGVHPIIEHQAVGYALADAKTALESARYLSWRACHALDMQSPGAEELAIQAKIYGSETAVRVITDLMRIVGIESYDHDMPLGRLLRDALALPIFDGGNMGVRRRQLHAMLTPADLRSTNRLRRGVTSKRRLCAEQRSLQEINYRAPADLGRDRCGQAFRTYLSTVTTPACSSTTPHAIESRKAALLVYSNFNQIKFRAWAYWLLILCR